MVQFKKLMACAVAFLILASACDVADDQIMDAFASAILGGVISACAIALINMVVACVPLCCGFGAAPVSKFKIIIGGVIILIGIICCFIPFFASLGACASVADTICNDCDTDCTDDEKEDI